MSDVSLVRLYLLRAAYLLVAVGLGLDIWPLIVQHSLNVSHMTTVVWSMLGAVSLLAAMGLRYPLYMLPVLFFELIWKTIWLSAFALPLYLADKLTDPFMQTVIDCVLIVIVAVVMPWRFVWDRFVAGRGDRWVSRAG